MSKRPFRLEVLFEAQVVPVIGRDAWALNELVQASSCGCTPIDNPAPRWSAYVFNLRQMGFEIETVTENHPGTFAGTHARYVLRSQVSILKGPYTAGSAND